MSLDKEKLKEELTRDEGRIPYGYKDSEGYLTIGVGHLIDKRKGGKLPDFIIDLLLEYDIEEKLKQIRSGLPWFDRLNDARKRVVVNMVFNLGLDGFLKFKKTIEYIKSGDYHNASTEMLDSKWAKQVGSRAIRLSQMMESG